MIIYNDRGLSTSKLDLISILPAKLNLVFTKIRCSWGKRDICDLMGFAWTGPQQHVWRFWSVQLQIPDLPLKRPVPCQTHDAHWASLPNRFVNSPSNQVGVFENRGSCFSMISSTKPPWIEVNTSSSVSPRYRVKLVRNSPYFQIFPDHFAMR